MTVVLFGNHKIGQGEGATLQVEYQNERGTWERRRVVVAGPDGLELDNRAVVTDPARIRARHAAERRQP
jgi:hypothetical protein